MTASVPAARGDPRPRGLRLLPRFLFVAERPVGYVLKAWLVGLIGSMALAGLVGAVFPAAEQPAVPLLGIEAVIAVVLIAPFFETLIMASAIAILTRFVRPGIAIMLSAAGWGVAHSLAAPIWGLVVWWPFLIFSTAYVTWRERSVVGAIALVTCIHALQNGIVMAAIRMGAAG